MAANFSGLIESVILNNPEIYGSAIAFEPYGYSAHSRLLAPHCHRDGAEIRFTYCSYEYFLWDWYQIPRELERPVWIEPHFSENTGNTVMSTYAVPFYRNESGTKTLTGIITADISPAWLQDIVSGIKIARTGYGFMITKNGTFATHPDSSLIMNETIFSVAEARGDPRLREIGRDMLRGKSGFIPIDGLMTGEKCWMAYAPLPSNGWSIGVIFPRDEPMADAPAMSTEPQTDAVMMPAILLPGASLWDRAETLSPIYPGVLPAKAARIFAYPVTESSLFRSMSLLVISSIPLAFSSREMMLMMKMEHMVRDWAKTRSHRARLSAAGETGSHNAPFGKGPENQPESSAWEKGMPRMWRTAKKRAMAPSTIPGRILEWLQFLRR